MIILIFSLSLSIGTGIYLPDPDLIHTGLSFPLSITATGRVRAYDIFASFDVIPTGIEDYDLDFYLFDLGFLIKTGIFDTRLGGGIGRIRRAIGPRVERGFCYNLSSKFGPRVPASDFTIFPNLGFKLISDAKVYTWIIGLGLEVGYEIR